MSSVSQRQEDNINFQSIFFPDGQAKQIVIPDYQRAFSWELKQIDLFIRDLVKYQGPNTGYYFGHFIVEENGHWEIVDGQQRITTWILFLLVCRIHDPAISSTKAYSIVDQFNTVSYDSEALKTTSTHLESYLKSHPDFDPERPPSDQVLTENLELNRPFTHSQRRLLLALLRFNRAFQTDELEVANIAGYIATIMTAHCSFHPTRDKSVAVNIFEMHNTRGVPLTTLEIIKAKLVKFVYDNAGEDRLAKVTQIQSDFGEIYGMEERLAVNGFRGEMSMDQLLRLHLRVIDDGEKHKAKDLKSPATNANADALIEYVDTQLYFSNAEKTQPKSPSEGLDYALRLASEFKKSVKILCEHLPAWDRSDSLVGDVLILERDLSCQFFLILCRQLENAQDMADGEIDTHTLLLWEKLLFTRDFHDAYHRKTYKDNFPQLFEASITGDKSISEILTEYLKDGFRSWDVTKDLQGIVHNYLKENHPNILENAYYWWKHKMIYGLYKYEISKGAQLRDIMKGTISVEHILPQEWQWQWIDGIEKAEDLNADQRDRKIKEVNTYINGIGNLLLLNPSTNTSLGNKHPSDKRYERICSGGFYADHQQKREDWRSSENWKNIIQTRGELIYEFIQKELIGQPMSDASI